MFDICPATVKGILNEDGINFAHKIGVPPLSNAHRNARVAFAHKYSTLPYHLMPNLIITDESTVEVCLEKGGIWRRRGHYPPELFYTKEAHPLSVMVWGGIGPLGFRTKLLHVKGSMDSRKYCHLLISNGIVANLWQYFGNDFVFQQDNAHTSIYQNTHNNIY